jgi:hypothetical protein
MPSNRIFRIDFLQSVRRKLVWINTHKDCAEFKQTVKNCVLRTGPKLSVAICQDLFLFREAAFKR